jgi:type IV/VI secretion system ImpK/VasF family protein
MDAKLAGVVYPVLREALRLKERVVRSLPMGGGPSASELGNRHADLKMLLLNDNEARAIVNYGEDANGFRGCRYALAAWLDDLFILNVPADSVCSRFWSQHGMELELYGTINGGNVFWTQATQAQQQGRLDALEVMYLCMMLGFRGALRGQPAQIKSWRDGIERQLRNRESKTWPDKPPEEAVETAVEPLDGRRNYRSALVWLGVLAMPLLVLIAVAAVMAFS